ncbi:MAG: YnfA family protein [Cytophagaceae bacterium]|nr:MAG: YnfA family protein [Cytophagaceae bacterium]
MANDEEGPGRSPVSEKAPSPIIPASDPSHTHGHPDVYELPGRSEPNPLRGKSLSIFILAGLFEIGGGYLIWQWLKEDKPVWYGVIGGLVLALYGVIATWQTADFGRVYATYGGIFIVLALLWAWKVDGFKPDKWDIIGASIALAGACIIIYMPRK